MKKWQIKKLEVQYKGVQRARLLRDSPTAVHYTAQVAIGGYRDIVLQLAVEIAQPSQLAFRIEDRFMRAESGTYISASLSDPRHSDVAGWLEHLPDFQCRLKEALYKKLEPWWHHVEPLAC